MALALLILSNEGGRDTITTIAANEQEANEAMGVLTRTTDSKFLAYSNPKAMDYVSRAWKVLEPHSE